MQQKNNLIYGCLFGQAIGDALGLGTEFMSKSEVSKNYPTGLTEYHQIIKDYHRSMFQPAAWGDDTDMMICIANAMIQDGKINLHTIAKNFQDWVHAPEARGIGQTTYKVLAFADYTEKPQQDEPASIGYTLKTLGAALWCLFHSESFEDGLLSVVNEGGDADTNAAVACAVLGAKFGYDLIPTKYVNGLIQKDKQKKIIEKLIKVVI